VLPSALEVPQSDPTQTLARDGTASDADICIRWYVACMRTTLNLDDELARRAKRLAAERGTTLTALIERGLRDVLLASEARAAYRLDLPTVKGSAPPDVDVSDREALLAAMEEERPEP